MGQSDKTAAAQACFWVSRRWSDDEGRPVIHTVMCRADAHATQLEISVENLPDQCYVEQRLQPRKHRQPLRPVMWHCQWQRLVQQASVCRPCTSQLHHTHLRNRNTKAVSP